MIDVDASRLRRKSREDGPLRRTAPHMTALQSRTAVGEWVALALARGSVAVAALGVTSMPTLALKMLSHALVAADAAPQPEFVEVAEWTSIADVNAALGSGAAVLLAAGIRDGASFFVVGRLRPPPEAAAT